ncbi:MAG: hypothetical protein P8100_06325 [bacterium]
MNVKEVIKDDKVLARLVRSADWNEGLGFYSHDEEVIQVGTWHYNKGKELLKHMHNEVERTILRTNEVLYVVSGKVKAFIYDLQENFVEELEVNNGDTLILLDCGHGYEILEDDTRVLEIKNGPYLGAETDRRRF